MTRRSYRAYRAGQTALWVFVSVALTVGTAMITFGLVGYAGTR